MFKKLSSLLSSKPQPVPSLAHKPQEEVAEVAGELAVQCRNELRHMLDLATRARELERLVHHADKRVAQKLKRIQDEEAAQREKYSFLEDPDRLATLFDFAKAPPSTQTLMYKEYALIMQALLEPEPLRPLSIMFATLHHLARPYLVSAFVRARYPDQLMFVDLYASEPTPDSTYVYSSPSGAVDLEFWKKSLPSISLWFGYDVEMVDITATGFALKRRRQLPEVITFTPAFLEPAHLFLGLSTESAQPFHVDMREMSHLLITGTVGMGKSVALASILASLLHEQSLVEHIHCIDPGSIAFSRFRGASPKLTLLASAEDLADLAHRLVLVMQAREQELGATGREKFVDRLIYVVIDEFPAYVTPEGADKASKDAHAVCMKNIIALARRGRKSGIRLILTVQTPTENDIPPNLRSVLPGILAFRTPVPAHAQQLFGELSALPADPRTLQRGRAIYRDATTGDIACVQFPRIQHSTNG